MNILVEHYDDTNRTENGYGYEGCVQPADRSWILYWDTDGKPLVWTERDKDGGVIGEPLS